MPFLIFSFCAIIYSYIFGYKNFSKNVGIIASLVFSFSLIFVFYAPIARMYISGVFFSIALLYYFFEIFYSNTSKTINYFLFALFALLSALNQHINALFAFTICFSGIFYLSKNNYKKYLITCACIILAYLAHLPITLNQFNIGGIGFEQGGGWVPKPTLYSIINFFKILSGTGKSYIVFLILIISTFFINKSIKLNKKQLYLIVVFLINFSIVYFYSIYRSSVYQHSVMLFSAVALVIFVSSLLNVKKNIAFYTYVVIILSLFIYKTYYKKNYYEQCVSNIFEYQFKRTAELKNKYGNSAVYPIYFDAYDFMKKIYFKKYKTTFDCKISSDSITFSLNKYAGFLANLKCNYVVLGSSYPTFQAVTKQYYPYLIENSQTQGVNFKVYSKLKSDEKKCVPDDDILNYASVLNEGKYTFSYVGNAIKNETQFSLFIDSINEFPFQAKSALNAVTSKEGQVILVTTKFKTQNLKFNNVGICISVNATQKDSCVAYSGKEVSDFILNSDSTITLFCDVFCGSNYHKIKNNSNFKTYIWNRGKQNFNLNSFEIKTINYWPQKWNFWE